MMTEAEWLACADPTPMLHFLRGKASDRKFHLFAVALCRQMSHWFGAPANADCVADLGRLLELGEREADGLANPAEVEEGARLEELVSAGGWSDFVGGAVGWDVEARQYFRHPDEWAVRSLATNCVHSWRYCGRAEWPEAAENAVHILAELASVKAGDAGQPTEPAGRAARARLVPWVREVFGDPFRPSRPLPAAVLAWNDRTVPRLAESIYEERPMPQGTLDAGRMAVLADALLDAGCGDEELLAHLRSEGPHARGCHGIDLTLGKS